MDDELLEKLASECLEEVGRLYISLPLQLLYLTDYLIPGEYGDFIEQWNYPANYETEFNFLWMILCDLDAV